MRPLSARERKLVAIGILVAAFAALWLGLISPVLVGFADRAEVRGQLQAQYARNARVLMAIPIWKHEVLAQQRDAARFEFRAATADLAAHQLQQYLVRTLNSAGGVLRSTGVMDGVSPGTVRARADAQLSMAQLNQVLKRLESGEPYVVVEYLSVGASRALETGHLATMDIRIQLAAAYHTVQPE